MKFITFVFLMGVVAGLVLLDSPLAFADKASATIDAPENAVKGSEISIRVTVAHSGNSARHHVEWVKIWVNSQELAKWEYTSSNLPEGVPFTRDVKYKVGEKGEVEAAASCNVHGGKGPATLQITIK